MDIDLMLSLLDPMIGITIEATLWMVQHPLLSIPMLVIEYIVLMLIWASAREQWWGRYYKIAAGIFFLPQDIVVNYFMAVLFLDKPAHVLETVTARMKRYRLDYGDLPLSRWSLERWRFGFANRFCRLLNKFDPTGTHC